MWPKPAFGAACWALVVATVATPVLVGHGGTSAANDGAPMHAKSPAARIHAAAVLDLIVIWVISPLVNPKRE